MIILWILTLLQMFEAGSWLISGPDRIVSAQQKIISFTWTTVALNSSLRGFRRAKYAFIWQVTRCLASSGAPLIKPWSEHCYWQVICTSVWLRKHFCSLWHTSTSLLLWILCNLESWEDNTSSVASRCYHLSNRALFEIMCFKKIAEWQQTLMRISWRDRRFLNRLTLILNCWSI